MKKLWVLAVAGVLGGCGLSGPIACGTVQWPEQAELSVEAAALARHLSGPLGKQRNTLEPENLLAADAYIRAQLGSAGLRVDAIPIAVPNFEGSLANLEVVLGGTDASLPQIVIGAHFDSAQGAPGANDNGSGVAALLELARWAKGRAFKRTLRMVFFANEEPPYFGTRDMGSAQYLSALEKDGIRVARMISLETLAYFTTQPSSQCLVYSGVSSASGAPDVVADQPNRVKCVIPGWLAGRGRGTGDFVAFVSTSRASDFVVEARDIFCEAKPGVNAMGVALPGAFPGSTWSDHLPFLDRGIPALMVTDTAPLRYPHYHKATDTPAQLTPQSMNAFAHVVRGLTHVIEVLANH